MDQQKCDRQLMCAGTPVHALNVNGQGAMPA